MPIRAFIALDTPGEVRTAMEAVREKLRSSGADVRWEPREKLHATIKFLGNVEDRLLPSIREIIQNCLSGISAFEVTFAGLGCFPSASRPRVVWIGCENASGTLASLKNDIDKSLLPLGFQIEEREFHPHVTLGRVKSPKNMKALTSMLQTVTFESHAALCNEFLLMKSTLRPQGSEYSVIQSFPLR